MNGSMSGAMTRAVIVGTLLQLAMVLAGHWVPAIAALFAPLGMAISFVAGWLVALWESVRGRFAATRGALAGGICALLGILVSFALGDVEGLILLLGTLSSTVTGALGGLVGGALAGRTASAGGIAR